MCDKNFVPAFRFMVVSDVHYKDAHTVERDRFEKAIEIAYRIARNHETYKKLDALFVVGDFADNGSEIQMRAFKDSIDRCVNKDETDVVITLASHEFSQKNGGEEAALERFSKIFNMPYDQHKVINGFHCISLTTTKGCRFDDNKKEFAAKALREAADDDPKKPIFFFQHPHCTDTVYGSICWGEDDLIPILANYPQVINFSGHSHAPINDPRSIHQRYFTALGTGSLSYFELDEFGKVYGTVPPKAENCAQMLIVEADKDNRVRVYPYDVLTDNYFPYVWKIDTPSDPSTFIYTDERYKTDIKPYFTEGARAWAEEIGKDSFVITFDQAKIDKDYVDGYDITVRNKATGAVEKQVSIWSEYYFFDMPKTLSQKIDGLKPDTEYEVEITAESFWLTESDNSLKTEFKTLAE
ncbi:MAG TPA: metallophosphoesterase [Clostridiales bacterium]|nr:metallophosphoesterase [Clostridiales bacterium]HQD72235.1 metallophosphoesterase [Clostridiales bacterium]